MDYKGMKLSEAKALLRKSGFKVIKENLNEVKDGDKITIQITFENGQDGLVANDCFQGLAAEDEIQDGEVHEVIRYKFCDIGCEYGTIVIHGFESDANEVAEEIKNAYDSYLPKIEVLPESFKTFAARNGYISEHRWAGYTFTKPTRNSVYVKALNFLYWAKVNDGQPMRKNDVHNWLGLSTAHGNHSAMWTEMADEGLVKYDKHTQAWTITDYGVQFLQENDVIIPLEELTDNIASLGEASEEPGYMRGELSVWDRRKIEQGRAPSWAKSVKDIPPRPKKLSQSSSASEIAMQSVNTPNGQVKRPYSETDLRRDQAVAKAGNVKIAEQLKKLLTAPDHIDADSFPDHFSVYMRADDKQLDEFRVFPRGTAYMVKFVGHRSVFDRDSRRCENLQAVADYINDRG